MEKTEVKISTDLQKFIDKFQPNKFKVLPQGIEIRGIKDMHRNVTQAKALIENLELDMDQSVKLWSWG